MSGQLYGKVECYSNPGGSEPEMRIAQEIFKGLYDFLMYLETQDVVVLRARYNGDSASGTDYHDGVSPFRTNAWFLFEWLTSTTSPTNPAYAGTRTEPFFIFVQFARGDQGIFAASGSGSPVTFKGSNISTGSAAIGMQMAVGVGGTLNPWNGTLGTFGSPASFGGQTKGTPVWTNPPSGGTGLYAFPKANSVGNYSTNRQALLPIYDANLANDTPNRYHFLADHDGLMVLIDSANTNQYTVAYSGVYSPRSGAPSTPPYIQLVHTGGTLQSGLGGIYGDIAGSSTLNGGIAFNGVTATTQVRGFMLSRLDEMLATTFQPNRWFGPPAYDEIPPTVGVQDLYGGVAGAITFFREVKNVTNLERNTAGTKLIVGSSTTSDHKIIVPWNSAVTPLSGLTRVGTEGAI